ncbi:hypothetical protein EL22_03060 [Halostagnicola sp. A56]|uniref:hypothetical protein n=1 Tax=Halostagnicola sp. A56 TaxID=1495067 RepID=UPI0004A0556D|nr:hypothetical protein [Halostagnicola sp. A56]KDE58706.1 hypothetical protein EL22_03060 [Halostagnicola sp. A56]
MASKQELGAERVSGTQAQDVGEQALGPALLASAASVGLSLYYYFVRGDRERGIFVGLWPPTILAFASYFNQRRMREQLEMITQPGSTIKNTIDSMMGNN